MMLICSQTIVNSISNNRPKNKHLSMANLSFLARPSATQELISATLPAASKTTSSASSVSAESGFDKDGRCVSVSPTGCRCRRLQTIRFFEANVERSKTYSPKKTNTENFDEKFIKNHEKFIEINEKFVEFD